MLLEGHHPWGLFDWPKKQSGNGDSPSTTTLSVSNLPVSAMIRQLRRLFAGFGRVVDVRIAAHPHLRIPLGFGAVEMAGGADAAIKSLNGATFDGCVLTVTEIKASPNQVEPDACRRLLLDHQRPAPRIDR